MAQFLYDEFEVKIGRTQLGVYLRKAQYSRKAVRRRAAQRNEVLRTAWAGLQRTWHPDQLLFLDESGANERTGDRKFGWAPIGKECQIVLPLKRSKRWSILPALDIKGYIAWRIFQGSINAEIFYEFLRDQVLPQCEPFPGKRSVIVMDNASIHKSQDVRDLCEAHGVKLCFLPPYSPDFNPIESTFKDLKAWLKKHYRESEEFEQFEQFLDYAVQENCRRDMKKYFSHCGYSAEHIDSS
jgi:transposase